MGLTNETADDRDNPDHPNNRAVVPVASASGTVVGRAGQGDHVDPMLSMIERALTDPSVSIEKLERVIAIADQRRTLDAIRSYNAAFVTMQPKLPEIDKRGKIIIKDKESKEKVIQSTPYALWDDTNRVIKPILGEHGFGLSFRISQTPDRLTTTAILIHVDGHSESTSFNAPIDNTGSKNNVQGWGSSFSYGKRYTGTAILNITTRGEDDDGKAAGAAPVSANKLADLKKMIAETGSDIGWICQHYSVETIDDLNAKQIAEAMSGLAARKRKQDEAAKAGAK